MSDTTITTRGLTYSENERQIFENNADYIAQVNYAREQEGTLTSDGVLALLLFQALAEVDPLLAADSLDSLAKEALAVAAGLRATAQQVYDEAFEVEVETPAAESKKK